MSRKRHGPTSDIWDLPDPDLFEPMLARDQNREPTEVVAQRDRLLGQVLHGARLISILGEGSAARVYRARHIVLEREYAVKVLSIPHAQKEDLVERFYREARALSRMRHPNIVGVVDSGTTPRGRPFLTMELLDGETLHRRLERAQLSHDELIRIALEILAGLSEAHRRGLVHRDLKPANVMLVQENGETVAKLLDFGIARLTGTHGAHLTAGEMLLGTPRYMAPEQAMNAAEVSSRSDLYSFGVVLYEMLAGHAPFEGTMFDVLDKQFNATPPALATNSGLEPVVYRLLEKDPARRPQNADEVRRLIETALDAAPQIRFGDRTGMVYVERERAHDTIDDALTGITLDGPTLLDAAVEPAEPFDDREVTAPAGAEPTVLRPRPARDPDEAPTNLRIFDETAEDAVTYDELTPSIMSTSDTEPDPPATRIVEKPMGSPAIWSTGDAHPLSLMLAALVLAFGTTLAVLQSLL